MVNKIILFLFRFGSTSDSMVGTGNVPNKNRVVRGVDNFSSYKVIFWDSEKIFTFLNAGMSAASNGAKNF